MRVPFNINKCVKQALWICHGKLKDNITIDENLDDSLPDVIGNYQQIKQVLVNLFINAAEAMAQQDKGTITITARATVNTIIIWIADTGSGIPENKLNDIWQPFYTTKGTGLGLSTSLDIIENHHGQIKAENQPTGGVMFTITLPVHIEEVV